MIDNVQLWFAKDENEKIVTINEIDKENKHDKYKCPLCGSNVVPRQGRINSWCFAHIDKSKCNGETMIHFWFKNKFLIKGDKFTVKADSIKEYIVKEILVEKEYQVGEQIYRPDVTVIAESGETIYFEMANTNKKKIEEYLDIWIELNNIVVEVDIKTLVNSSINNIKEFNALYYNGKCFNVKKGNTYYNTIGKYKEELKQNGEYEKRKIEIKKLDWFWKDVTRYKTREIDIVSVVDLMDNIEDDEKNIIEHILLKPSCISIIEDYICYKESLIKKEIKRLSNLSIQFKDFRFERSSYSRKNFFHTEARIFYSCTTGNFHLTFRLFEHSEQYIKSSIIQYIQDIEDRKTYEKIISSVCNSIEEHYKNIKGIEIYKECEVDGYYRIIMSNFLDDEKLEFKFTFRMVRYFKYKRWNGTNLRKKELIYDLMDFNAEYVQNFVFEIVEEEIKLDKILRVERIEKNKAMEKEKVIRTLSGKDYCNRNCIHSEMDKIHTILQNSGDKILDIKLSYYTIGKCINGIYFKDYRNKEFIIYDDAYIGMKGYEKLLIFKELQRNKGIQCIRIDFDDKENIYVVEEEDTYKFKNRIKGEYQYSKYFDNPQINLSFKKINNTYIELPRYNFVNVTKTLESLIKEIKELERTYFNDFECNKICEIPYITNKEIDNKIKNLLYPMMYVADRRKQESLNLILNINFTKGEGKLKPWIIKDFIEVLQLLKIKNINNIIR
jgi:hypothetical protein